MTIDQYKAVFHAVERSEALPLRESILEYSPIYCGGDKQLTRRAYEDVQDIAFAAADKIKSILEDTNEIL